MTVSRMPVSQLNGVFIALLSRYCSLVSWFSCHSPGVSDASSVNTDRLNPWYGGTAQIQSIRELHPGTGVFRVTMGSGCRLRRHM